MKSKILKALPKAVAAVTVTFQNHPFSPGKDHKSKSTVSMIPHEARRKTHDRNNNDTDDIYSQEPTSPKISCMGQIKHKKKQIKKSKSISKSMPKEVGKVASKKSSSASREKEVKKHVSTFQKMLLFHGGKPKSEGRKSNASAPVDIKREHALADAARAPGVSQMMRFSSGRDALADFDWKVARHVTPDEEEIGYYSDEYRVESSDDGQEEDEVIIPFSAPLLVGGGGVLNLKPRKEINLWKRRTMAPPRPLQLDTAN